MSKLNVLNNLIFVDQAVSTYKVHDDIAQLNLSELISEQIENQQISFESTPVILTEENEELFNFFYPVRYIDSTVYHLANKPVFFFSGFDNSELVLKEEMFSVLISGNVPEKFTNIDITMRIVENIIQMYRLEISRLRNKFDEYEADLHRNKNNQILISLNDFEQTLFYYIDGLKSNLAVLRLSRTLKDTQKLETTIAHLIQMAETSVAIITSTRETFSNVIANDLNIVMKLLTIITVCLAVPNLFFSFYGMNVGLPFQNFEFSYVIIAIVALVISILIYRKVNQKN